MTSPVDTSVKNFNNTMVNAPVFNGVTGATIALLDACLVTGFDIKTLVSLVALGGVMTATFSGTHSSQVDSVLLVAGVTGGPTGFAGANGEQKVVAAPLPTTRTWATSLPDGTYTGTITIKMAAAGWEKVFTGTNKAVYRSLDPVSTKMLLRVDDSGTTIARVVGYEAMTDVDTGTGAFPTAAQLSGGGAWAKSTAASAAVVPWTLQADARTFYFSPVVGSATGPTTIFGSVTRCFGDLLATKPGGDPYACVLNYSVNVASASAAADNQVFTGAGLQMATPRGYTGLGSSSLHCTVPYIGTNTFTSGSDGALGPFPSVIDGALYLSRRYVAASTTSPPRGDLPGVLSSPQSLLYDSFKQLDRAPGSGLFAGRTLQAVTPTTAIGSGSTNVNTGIGFIDITGPWR